MLAAMLFPAPPAPAFPDDQALTTEAHLRYEDVAQDGRLIPIAIPPVLGGFWRGVLRKHGHHRAALAKGMLPLLTRMTIESFDQPIRVDQPVQSRTGFELAHDVEGGEVSRLFMNVWAEVHGAGGKIGSREPGPLALAGRMFAEHTFTRPFAPAEQRRVTRFDLDGYPEPTVRYDYPPAPTAQDAPAGARWLDELAPDPVDLVFSLDQTDSNQHVNNLAYVRLLVDATQRRIASLGNSLKLRSRAVDIAYRKPAFVGDRVRVYLRPFELAGGIGAAGFIATPGDEARPRCYGRVLFGA
jgi:hypothetical protein